MTDAASSTRLSANAASGSCSSSRYTASGSVCVTPGQVAGEGDGGPELAERARPAENGPGGERRQHHGQGHPAQDGEPTRTERRGGLLVADVRRAQRALDGDHEERHGDERLGDHDARRS